MTINGVHIPARPAPRLGEHTESVLADRLGLSRTSIIHLRDSGIVATEPPKRDRQ